MCIEHVYDYIQSFKCESCVMYMTMLHAIFLLEIEIINKIVEIINKTWIF